jgi:SAM-dependent methyltransferase
MSDWGGGYITDIAYIAGFHKIEEPAQSALGALLSGFHASIPRREDALHLVDIGCGHGINALVAAAANPGWRVTGLDFNPAHIAAARELAAQAGLANIAFIEADLRDFAASPAARALPAFDAVSMHGVWSWVRREVQDGIIRLLADKLAAGGQVHVSYNQTTGWAGQLGMQRLIRAAGMRLAARSDAQAAAGYAVFQELLNADGSAVLREGFGGALKSVLEGAPAAYLAHEFMNANWAPVMHGDVADRLAEAKLDYAGSARLVNNFTQLMLSAEQLAVLARFDDPAMTELFKDVCRPERLRTDVFIRGARRIDAATRDARLYDLTVALQATEAEWRFTFNAGFGKAELAESYYRAIFNRLKAGPARLRELLALPELAGRNQNPAEVAGVGIGTDQLVLVANPGAEMDTACRRLNAAMLKRQLDAGQAEAITFAVPAIGGGITLPKLEGFLTHELITAPDRTAPEDLADRLGVPRDQAQRDAFAHRLARYFDEDAPLLKHLGLPLPV